MDVWEYFLQKQLEWAERGALPDRAPFEELEGSDGKRGRVHCNLELTEYAYLRVLEHVVVKGTGIHRELYAYSLIIDEAHAHGWRENLVMNPPYTNTKDLRSQPHSGRANCSLRLHR